jgi:hypothetical protein
MLYVLNLVYLNRLPRKVARLEVAHGVETTLNSSLYFHIQALGMGMEAGPNEFFDSVVKSLVSITLKGCIIEKTEICKDRVFVMVTYDEKKEEKMQRLLPENWKKKKKVYIISSRLDRLLIP